MRKVTFGAEEVPKRDAVVGAYPTDQRRREKEARAKAGGVKPTPKKKPQIVEQHFDDCGEDFSTLEEDPDEYLLSCVEEAEEIDDSVTCLTSWRFGLGGSRALLTSKHDFLVKPSQATHYHDMQAFSDGWASQARPPRDVEVVELCGGEFGRTHLLVRRTSEEQCERYANDMRT